MNLPRTFCLIAIAALIAGCAGTMKTVVLSSGDPSAPSQVTPGESSAGCGRSTMLPQAARSAVMARAENARAEFMGDISEASFRVKS